MRKIVWAAIFTMAGLVGCSDKGAIIPVWDGAWVLSERDSSVSYVSQKNGSVEEDNNFSLMTGQVDAEGKMEIFLILDSVQTNIDIRNSRMRQYVFETKEYPFVKVSADIDMSSLKHIPVGENQEVSIFLNVDMHGVRGDVIAETRVSHLIDGRVKVETLLPILINAADYGYLNGVEALREIANLDAILPIVPVRFSLIFSAK